MIYCSCTETSSEKLEHRFRRNYVFYWSPFLCVGAGVRVRHMSVGTEFERANYCDYWCLRNRTGFYISCIILFIFFIFFLSIHAGMNNNNNNKYKISNQSRIKLCSSSAIILWILGTDPHLLSDPLHGAPDAGPAVAMYYLADGLKLYVKCITWSNPSYPKEVNYWTH